MFRGNSNLMKKPLVLSVIVALAAVACCIGGTQTSITQSTDAGGPTTQVSDSPEGGGADLATAHVLAVDSETKRPMGGVLVFLRSAQVECETDGTGRCSIIGFARGDYSLNAYMRGYARYSSPASFARGDNDVTVELVREPVSPQSLTVDGLLFVDVVAKGSRSENRYLKLRTAGADEYVFNRYGQNAGYGEYVGKTVRITGYRAMGSIGWQAQKTEGIYVEEIRQL
jgi:hypothetical protein